MHAGKASPKASATESNKFYHYCSYTSILVCNDYYFHINIVIATMITFLVPLLTAIDLTFYRTLLEP